MKKVKFGVVIATIGALGMVFGSLVPASSQEAPRGTTIELLEKETWGRELDTKPIGKFNPGDGVLFQSRLSDATTEERAGKMVGHVVTHKRLGKREDTRFIGDATVKLADGTITIYGAGMFRQFESGFTASVTGGTGAYAGARGEFLLTEIDSEDFDTRITITLLQP